jgi:hypothetical protein
MTVSATFSAACKAPPFQARGEKCSLGFLLLGVARKNAHGIQAFFLIAVIMAST